MPFIQVECSNHAEVSNALVMMDKQGMQSIDMLNFSNPHLVNEYAEMLATRIMTSFNEGSAIVEVINKEERVSTLCAPVELYKRLLDV
ncbi:hypothetical protein L2735_14050 [Shewanella olleyana]|uniref:hypothetical protein n=1 Tax=Shewanella olleyana TaxID=135626 RepID=UPI00200DC0F9|nr:hypothetical protein [Shewanella olleyana]MCL1067913.1 hypothetical protein [Shewanella olleyana]